MGSSCAKLFYRPGTSVANADALSRLSLPETVEVPAPEPVLNLLQHCDSNNDQGSTENIFSSITCAAVCVTALVLAKNVADEFMPFFN